MPAVAFEKLYEHVMEMLQALDPSLTYHSIHHTRDVVRQAEARGAADEDVVLLEQTRAQRVGRSRARERLDAGDVIVRQELEGPTE